MDDAPEDVEDEWEPEPSENGTGQYDSFDDEPAREPDPEPAPAPAPERPLTPIQKLNVRIAEQNARIAELEAENTDVKQENLSMRILLDEAPPSDEERDVLESRVGQLMGEVAELKGLVARQRAVIKKLSNGNAGTEAPSISG